MKRNTGHVICFRDTENDWDSALPVGNGRMGAMVFLQGSVLHIAINHYDCYYHALPRPGKRQDNNSKVPYTELCRRADEARRKEGTDRSHYARTLHPPQETDRPFYKGASFPSGGELLLTLDEKVNLRHSCLKLNIDEALITFEAGSGDWRVTAEILAATEHDGVLLFLSQTQVRLWKESELLFPPEEADFTQELAFCPGQTGRFFTAALSLKPGLGKAKELTELLVKEADMVKRLHSEYWRRFWSGTVRLPDNFLERLWHLQVYLLECSCGRGSTYPEQACGLSGLWDIRKPNMWGSTWYWDVNIQSTFWGIGCAGHPELLKLFCDGYLAYEEDIREYTRQVYGVDGWALDYPHTLYHCIQPWCAQFLWQYYQYSGDRKFLEEKAYPVFREQIAFFEMLAEQDAEGILHVMYDISPEQGPVTMDSVITISSVRKLIRIAMEAGKVLNNPEEEIKTMEALLRALPQYPQSADGTRYKDSLLVQDSVFLRHPSMLMPLFPAEEVDTTDNLKYWENTLKYAAEHTETGTFGMGWLSAAAARLGRGRTALRLLYEKGLDYVLHANGLAYEESERFLNYCHVTKPPHYLPVMMESAGGIINAVNQMLLQTGTDGVIRIFPAIPDETEDLLEKIVQYREDDYAVEGKYDSWEDVSFAGLIAPGGFKINAGRKSGLTVFLKVESTTDARLKLLVPGHLSENGQDSMLERKMKAGEIICFGKEPGGKIEHIGDAIADSEILCHTAARTYRRIFLGANRHTAYYRAIDAFTCAYLLANEHRYARTPYIFDFGTKEGKKSYDDSYPRQLTMTGQCIQYSAGPRRIGAEEYQPETGYGFLKSEGIRVVYRNGPDDLRRDLLEGCKESIFTLRLPKGKYDLLVISGDEEEASSTVLSLSEHGTTVRTGRLEAGDFACKILPVIQERDGELLLRITAEIGFNWKLNALFVNKEYGIV